MNQKYIDCYLKKGKEKELEIALKIEEKLGGKCYPSSTYEDTSYHIDTWWHTPKKRMLGIDSKSIKKNSREDKDVDDTINWIETKNIKGNKGWIYGRNDYIAFETLTNVIFVKTQKLRDLTDFHNISKKEIASKLPEEFFIPYRREGKQDVIYKVPTSLLVELSHFIMDK